jgi:hypothetical protein
MIRLQLPIPLQSWDPGTGVDVVAGLPANMLKVGIIDTVSVVGQAVASAVRRLIKDEFEARIGQVFATRTYADLAAVTAGLIGAQLRKPARARAGR